MTVGIVLFAHGSRDPEWATPFARLAQRISALRPDARVVNAYLEQMHPTLEECAALLVADGVGEIVIAPVFLAPGGHVKRDLARIAVELRARYPLITLRVLATIGESEALLDAMANWIADCE
jgi:sirohydrochlorin cobaltochelatase